MLKYLVQAQISLTEVVMLSSHDLDDNQLQDRA